METVKLCKRGHEKTPENVYANGACKLCAKEYELSPEYKAYKKEYQKSPEYKAYQKEYRQSPEYKAYQKEYRQSPDGKAKIKAYHQLPEYKAYRNAYQQLQADNLRDSYITNLLGLKVAEATQELIEITRNRILEKRERKKAQQTTQASTESL